MAMRAAMRLDAADIDALWLHDAIEAICADPDEDSEVDDWPEIDDYQEEDDWPEKDDVGEDIEGSDFDADPATDAYFVDQKHAGPPRMRSGDPYFTITYRGRKHGLLCRRGAYDVAWIVGRQEV